MRRLLLILLIVFPASLCAEEEISPAFRFFQINYTVMTYADFTLAYTCLNNPDYKVKEGNPIANFYIDYPELSLITMTAWNLFVYCRTTELYKENKTLAWITVISINVIYGYILIHNLRMMRE